MPLPPVGTIVVRVEDGKRGHIAVVGDETRVVYEDRGSPVVAPKRELWLPAAEQSRRLRPEEMLEVAIWADRSLRSLERHEPFKHWEDIDPGVPPYDKGLRDVILTYLRARG